MKRFSLILGLILFLSSCGYHLRGMIEVPPWLTHVALISKENNLEFAALLKEQLRAYHIKIIPDPDLAEYWLVINPVSYHKQIVSIGSSTNPRQYQLLLSVSFLFQTQKAKVLIPERFITVTRQLTVNNDRILGSDDEERTLISEMKQDAVIQIINRLGTVDI